VKKGKGGIKVGVSNTKKIGEKKDGGMNSAHWEGGQEKKMRESLFLSGRRNKRIT